MTGTIENKSHTKTYCSLFFSFRTALFRRIDSSNLECNIPSSNDIYDLQLELTRIKQFIHHLLPSFLLEFFQVHLNQILNLELMMIQT